MSTSLQANDTFVQDATSSDRDRINIEDWSQTGRGSHIDFGDQETVPIVQGRFLGEGSFGAVHETTIQGHKLAHKRVRFNGPIGKQDRREIHILKRLCHVHIVQLIGTYTQRRYIGILMYPVAICDLRTFFEDVEAWSKIVSVSERGSMAERRSALDSNVESRLRALGYDFPQGNEASWASIVYSRIGCLVSAITYLHEQKVRHKDLKPMNILLSPGSLWLSDFGTATDFALLSHSATDSERGTLRYCAPETIEFESNGRAADMFSLGCVLVEILSCNRKASLPLLSLRAHPGAKPTYYANVKHLSTWLKTANDDFSRREHYLECEINLMLSADPKRRPKAIELLHGIASHEVYPNEESTPSIFGDCCKRTLVPQSQLRKMLDNAAGTTQLMEELKTARGETRQARSINEQNEMEIRGIHVVHAEALKQKEAQLESRRFDYEYVSAQLANRSKHLTATKKTVEGLRKDLVDCKIELTDSQAAHRDLEDEVLHLKAQITASRDRDNLAGRASFAEDTISFDTVPKRNRDKSSHLLNVEEEHDKYIGQIPNIAHGHVRDLDSEKDQRIDQSSKTQADYVRGRTSPWSTKSRSTYDDLGPGAFRKTELHRSASSQANIPVVPQSDRYARSESFDTKMERPTKPKLGFLEVLAHGVKAGVPSAKYAAKVAYEQSRR